jgi:parvulin-like peptidyl-prolyl isomerase
MSKKRQTTGLPKRSKRQAPGETLDGTENVEQQEGMSGYRSRAEQEEEVQSLVVRGVMITIGILIAVLVVAFTIDQVVIPNQVVASVNGEGITVAQFREAVNFERNRLTIQLNQIQSAGIDINQLAQQEPYQTWISELNVPDQLGLRVLNDMIDDVLIRQDADRRNIQVDDETLQEQINTFFGYDPDEVALIGVEPTATDVPTETPTPFVSPTPSPVPTETPTLEADATEEVVEPTLTPQATIARSTLSAEEVTENFNENQQNYRDSFSIAGVSSNAVDAYFERLAIDSLLADAVFEGGDSLLYADVRHILVDTEETALEIIDALANGESFADLAAAQSTDTGSGARGGELGLSNVSNYVPEFRDAVTDAEIGAIVGPVESEFGFHIIQVRSKEERSGDAVANELETAKQQAFAQYVDSLRADNEENIDISDSWVNYVPGN